MRALFDHARPERLTAFTVFMSPSSSERTKSRSSAAKCAFVGLRVVTGIL
jgi:hypothetical protein